MWNRLTVRIATRTRHAAKTSPMANWKAVGLGAASIAGASARPDACQAQTNGRCNFRTKNTSQIANQTAAHLSGTNIQSRGWRSAYMARFKKVGATIKANQAASPKCSRRDFPGVNGPIAM